MNPTATVTAGDAARNVEVWLRSGLGV